MARRRSRYTVTTESLTGEQTQHVVLAYDPIGARAFYAKRGYTILSVQVGDYRTREQVAKVRAGGGFVIDQAALKAATELLDLRLPIRIRYNSRVGQTAGNYRFKGSYHDIMLKSYHEAAEASACLWHELCHAMQAERVGGTTETWRQSNREQARYSYKRRPIEIEARALARQMADCPLTKEA